MDKNFVEMGIEPPILKAIEEMGFDKPTKVQSMGIPHIMKREDLIVISKTGSGKTAVFGIPMLQLTDPDTPGPQGLILAPTRELAVQVDSDLKEMSKYLPHKTVAVYGQHSINVEIDAINKGVSIISGTPGRVYDHIRHGKLSTKNIRFLVLDEADRMLDMGFFDQVIKIIRTLPKERVTLLLSATMPAEVRRICKEYMKQPGTIEIESPTKTVDTTKQVYCRVDRSGKNIQLNRILLVEQPESCMIFCNTKMAVDRVQSFLARKGHSCQSLHGDIPQSKRMQTIQQFKRGEFRLLVATDVAARGIHIDDLSLVINYDVPGDKDSYVHRIGRTGRVGEMGLAITMVSQDDLMSLYEIEEHIGAMITEIDPPTDAAVHASRASAEQWMKEGLEKNKTAQPQAPDLTHSSVAPHRSDKPEPSSGKPRADRPASRRPETDRPAARKPEQKAPVAREADAVKTDEAGNPAAKKRSRKRRRRKSTPQEAIAGQQAVGQQTAGRSQGSTPGEQRKPGAAAVEKKPAPSLLGRLLQKITGK